jgi:hypothetical protein
MKKLLGFIILSSLALSCNRSTQEFKEKTYFDLAGLVDKEVAYLKKNKPMVSKSVKINEAYEEIKGTDIDWSKELEILKLSDLNKAAFKLSYDVKENKNLIQYTLKEDEKQSVALLTFIKNDAGEITQIESIQSSENYLYSSSKTVKVNLENGHIKNYSLKGWQKLFVGSQKNFEVKGEIL